jgi:hypothetical protein
MDPAAAFTVRLFASLSLGLGLAALYLRWRDRKASNKSQDWRRFAVPAGWGLIVLGLNGWLFSGAGDVAVSDAVTLVMMLAIAVIGAHALTLDGPKKAVRARSEPNPESDNDGLELGRGYWSRVAARMLGCVVAAPAIGLMAGALWRAYAPGDKADTLMMMATIALLVMPVAWVIQLASTRPWRAFAGLALAAVTAAAFIYVPMGL